ncbi:hypothetical protein C4A43_03919 [Escherichia coli]|nr:hypothetical protein C4A43_03919 [Escherichia coli]
MFAVTTLLSTGQRHMICCDIAVIHLQQGTAITYGVVILRGIQVHVRVIGVNRDVAAATAATASVAGIEGAVQYFYRQGIGIATLQTIDSNVPAVAVQGGVQNLNAARRVSCTQKGDI